MSTTPPENKLQSARQKISAMLHDPENPLAGVFEKAEKTLKLKREYLFIGLLVVLVVFICVFVRRVCSSNCFIPDNWTWYRAAGQLNWICLPSLQIVSV